MLCLPLLNHSIRCIEPLFKVCDLRRRSFDCLKPCLDKLELVLLSL